MADLYDMIGYDDFVGANNVVEDTTDEDRFYDPDGITEVETELDFYE